MLAYDIEMLTRPVDRADPDDKGWCFGLPPGITPEQWPLDPATGYPLMHGFTLLLPEDYRCHGPDIVGLSLFGTPCDHGDGFHVGTAVADALVSGAPESPDPELAALQAAHLRHHPRTHWMKDGLGATHAIVLLTSADYAAPVCRPPKNLPCRQRARSKRPLWHKIGSAAAAWQFEFPNWKEEPYEDYFLYRFLGGVPPSDIAFNRAIRYRPRPNDPNAGVPTCEFYDPDPTGYQEPHYKDENGEFREHDWFKDASSTYIGGTMHVCQEVPRFSPYHLGFPEEFGGYNFGGGSAQLDFKDFKFDWDCG